MKKEIIDYVPKTKRKAVRDAYKDEDGYWIYLKEGWEASNTDSGCRTIHEDTIADLRYQISGIRKVKGEHTMAKTNIAKVEALTGCTAGLEITEDFSKAVKYQVEYESGSVRYYDVDKTPKTVQSWIDSHIEPEPEQEPDPKETPMERAENFAQQMLQLPVAVQGKAWKELETVLEPEELETAKKYVGSYHLLTDQAFYNTTRDALAEELYQELHEPKQTAPAVIEPVHEVVQEQKPLPEQPINVIPARSPDACWPVPGWHCSIYCLVDRSGADTNRKGILDRSAEGTCLGNPEPGGMGDHRAGDREGFWINQSAGD